MHGGWLHYVLHLSVCLSVCLSVYLSCAHHQNHTTNDMGKVTHLSRNWDSNYEVERLEVKVSEGGKRMAAYHVGIGAALTCYHIVC